MMMESPVGTTYELYVVIDRSRPELMTAWFIVGKACALSDPTLSSSLLRHRWPLVQMTAMSGIVSEDAAGGQSRG